MKRKHILIVIIIGLAVAVTMGTYFQNTVAYEQPVVVVDDRDSYQKLADNWADKQRTEAELKIQFEDIKERYMTSIEETELAIEAMNTYTR